MSRGLGDVYKRQGYGCAHCGKEREEYTRDICLLYTSDAADDTPCVDLGGRRIIKKMNNPVSYTHLTLP
ncbi:hypothetical protein, partial [Staphylococcus aureus]